MIAMQEEKRMRTYENQEKKYDNSVRAEIPMLMTLKQNGKVCPTGIKIERKEFISTPPNQFPSPLDLVINVTSTSYYCKANIMYEKMNIDIYIIYTTLMLRPCHQTSL